MAWSGTGTIEKAGGKGDFSMTVVDREGEEQAAHALDAVHMLIGSGALGDGPFTVHISGNPAEQDAPADAPVEAITISVAKG